MHGILAFLLVFSFLLFELLHKSKKRGVGGIASSCSFSVSDSLSLEERSGGVLFRTLAACSLFSLEGERRERME